MVAFFAKIHHHAFAQQSGFLMFARYQGRAVAGGIFLFADEHAGFKYGASNLVFQGGRTNNVSLWRAIQLAVGVNSLSRRRSSARDDGLFRFKLGWGSSEHHVWNLTYDDGLEGFVQEPNGAYAWHNAIFRGLPRFMSRITGGALYRHWSVPVAGSEFPGWTEKRVQRLNL